MSQITASAVYPAGFQPLPPPFVPAGQMINFPAGTVLAHDATTWALYVNTRLNKSWVGYATPKGTRIVARAGVKRVHNVDFEQISRFVRQKQVAGCGACDEE